MRAAAPAPVSPRLGTALARRSRPASRPSPRAPPPRPRRLPRRVLASAEDSPRGDSPATPGRRLLPDPLGLRDPIAARAPSNPSPSLISADLAPVPPGSARTFGAWDVANLWIGMVVCVPAFTLAGSVVSLGVTPAQGIACICFANAVVLLPMLANGHAGCKYGAPFPALARAAFGVRGAKWPVLLRGLVGCGWFGIQTDVGGKALRALLDVSFPTTFAPWAAGLDTAVTVPAFGVGPATLGCFLAFLAAQMALVARGVESVRALEELAAPALVALTLAVFLWAVGTAGGWESAWGLLFEAPVMQKQPPGASGSLGFTAGDGGIAALSAFAPVVNAVIGFWATLSLNISDFTRFSRSQAVQFRGQLFGLPVFMAGFSVVSVIVTGCCAKVYKVYNLDPASIASLAGAGHPAIVACSCVGLLLATLSTNIAANVVAPANAFANAWPSRITFFRGALLTAAVGTALAPWRLAGDAAGYLFVWLGGYGAALGPVAGVMIADYYVVRGRTLDVDGLYADGEGGAYWYQGGWNPKAFACVLAGLGPCLPGFLQAAGVDSQVGPTLRWVLEGTAFLRPLYDHAWVFGFVVAGVSYALANRGERAARAARAAGAGATRGGREGEGRLDEKKKARDGDGAEKRRAGKRRGALVAVAFFLSALVSCVVAR